VRHLTLHEGAAQHNYIIIAVAGRGRTCAIYEGMEIEGELIDNPTIGSIVGGGRYSDSNSRIWGVGVGMGLSRFRQGIEGLAASEACRSADVLAVYMDAPNVSDSLKDADAREAFHAQIQFLEEKCAVLREEGVRVRSLGPHETIGFGATDFIRESRRRDVPYLYIVNSGTGTYYDTETGSRLLSKPPQLRLLAHHL
jgi:hypothetical protein